VLAQTRNKKIDVLRLKTPHTLCAFAPLREINHRAFSATLFFFKYLLQNAKTLRKTLRLCVFARDYLSEIPYDAT
jgi:hypothetical protein